ncbi:MAG TPA: Flp family type IVb pilin [Pirellulaceae bacterium]|nr:Flp family type IVb pilin [Pirellulaceae bacterium]
MRKLYYKLRNHFSREEGATMVEYGLMVALIAVVCLIAVTALGTNISAIFTQIAGAV